ncbi:zinc finger protein 614-like isoform X2 [Sparus aurata]|uniref:zinc finger protein 614-like isoform X2 n=1 Tax=Sparus aurata TaxID=8175 RepID=UPI0011C0DDF9|nr:zinc finger protein 614-like isoform X2 [Sparus aurata]
MRGCTQSAGPKISHQNIELQQQHLHKEHEVLTDQQLCNQEWNSSLDQEDPEPPQIKEEQEELCTGQEEEQLVVKLETDTFMLIPPYEENDNQLLSDNSHIAESQDQNEDKHGDSRSTRDTESEPNPKERHYKIRSPSNSVYKPTRTGIQCNIQTELQQQHVYRVQEVLTDQLICNQERNSSLDQENPDPPQIKEEQEELCTTQEGEQLVVKLETDTFMLTPAYEENDGQLPSDNSHVVESQDQNEDNHGDSNSTRETEIGPKERHYKIRSPSNSVYKPTRTGIQCNIQTGKKSYKCDSCGKECRCKSQLNVHMRTHTGERPYICKTCGKRFTIISALKRHMRIHTDEKPYFCNTCGKHFRNSNNLSDHMRTHTGEKPYSCNTCGKHFRIWGDLKVHIRTHTGEKPYSCNTCGKNFRIHGDLKVHMRTHTGEKPYLCNTCGKRFTVISALKRHMRVHMDA